ncbi:MAG TPA: hypothetical protein VHX44_02780 [Planctomycetota bacterium]|jgi:hypothetical protein|nr:hypothetical protein [Planctomycetota bacterium]
MLSSSCASLLRQSLPLLLLVPLARAVEPSPAAGIAAKVIRERALALETHGQAPVAGELRALADQLAGGTVFLADAALVVQIALTGNAAGIPVPEQTPEQRRAAANAAARATSILDGDVAAAPVSTAKPTAPEPHIDEKALAVPVATTVLIASYISEPKSLLVMIGAGKDQQIAQGQRFVVKRGDVKIAVISATQIKNNQTICIAIPGTLADGAEIKPGDAVTSE